MQGPSALPSRFGEAGLLKPKLADGTSRMPSDSNAHAALLAGLLDTGSPGFLNWLRWTNSACVSRFLPHGGRRSLGFFVSPGECHSVRVKRQIAACTLGIATAKLGRLVAEDV